MTTVILACATLPHASAADRQLQASVALGEDGKLVYTPDERGNQIPDFSRCGYMGGGVKIPDVPVKLTLEPRPGMVKELAAFSRDEVMTGFEGDDTERIQQAIDKVSAMPLDENGFRGAVLLKRGVYVIEGALSINASGVVLRGEGQFKDGTILLAPATEDRGALLVAQGNRKLTEAPGSRREIADEYVPWGVKAFNLKSTKGLSVGDQVIIFRPNTEQWLDDIGMTKLWGGEKWFHFFDMRFEREIVAIDGNRITLDAPTVNAMENKYGGGFVYKYTEDGAISQVGIEHLRLIAGNKVKVKTCTCPPGDACWHGGPYSAVAVNSGCVNTWVRNVSTVHFSFMGVGVDGEFITVQDCAYLQPMMRKGAPRGYPYQLNPNAQYTLFQRCYAGAGRHCNSCSAGVRGPNAWLDMVNDGWDAGPHHRWSMGILYDNVKAHAFTAKNRGNMGSGHGWAGAQIVFWNVTGGKAAIGQPPTARNYMFGMAGLNGSKTQLKGKAFSPRSLYLRQLEDRLGKEAVENVTTEAQRKAVMEAPKANPLSKWTILYDEIRSRLSE